MRKRNIPAWYYQQFDADHTRDVPGEGYGGWKKAVLGLDLDKTALVVMHAWDCGRYEDYPGWFRAVEYIPRAEHIAATVFPPLLQAFRERSLAVLHVAYDEAQAGDHPGYKATLDIIERHGVPGISPVLPRAEEDEISKTLKAFRNDHVFVGTHNQEDVRKGFAKLDFMKQAMPKEGECVVVDSNQLHAVCLEKKLNHLIYIGFAINWCLQYNPGNMNDMADRGFLCSTVREAVTAVENRESARLEAHKEYALWVTALRNGFVFNLDDLLEHL